MGTVASGYEIYRSISKGRQLAQLQQTAQEQTAQINQLEQELKTLQEQTAQIATEANQQAKYKNTLRKYEFLLQALSDKLRVSSPSQQIKICEQIAKLNLQPIQTINLAADHAIFEQAISQLEIAAGNVKNIICQYTSADHIKTYLQNHQEHAELFLENPTPATHALAQVKTKNHLAHSNSDRVKKSVSMGFKAGTAFLGLSLIVTSAIAGFILTPAVLVSLPITTVLLTSASLLALSAAACVLTSVTHYKYVVPRNQQLETLKSAQDLKINDKKISTLVHDISNEKTLQMNHKNITNHMKQDTNYEVERINRHVTNLVLDMKTHQKTEEPLNIVNIAHPNLKPKTSHSDTKPDESLQADNIPHPGLSEGI